MPENTEHFATLVDRAPQIDELAIHLAEYFVEMPGVPGTAPSRTKPPCILGSELQAPEPDGLV